jgi:hypothetical protein
MPTQYFYYRVILLSIVMHQPIHAKFWHDVSEWFHNFGKKHQEVIDRQYRCNPGGSLIIKNPYGDVRIETEWKENSIVLSAKKRAQSPQALKACDIIHQETDNGSTITISTLHHDPELEVTVDYTLIVPAHLRITIEIDNGDIIIRDNNGSVHASTGYGDIDLYNCRGPLYADVATKGSITINQAEGSINATTGKGTITIFQSHDNVTAKTTYGRIRVYCKELPHNKELWLQTKTGSIHLSMPTTINADIRVKTEDGTIQSELPITINTLTTLLDARAWKRFKQEIQGILGVSPEARIRLYSRDSNIEIKKLNE